MTGGDIAQMQTPLWMERWTNTVLSLAVYLFGPQLMNIWFGVQVSDHADTVSAYSDTSSKSK